MEPLSTPTTMTERDREIDATVVRERTRLRDFIRRRIGDTGEAEDILQDVFHEFVQAYRLPEPIEQVSAWLFRVARNRIIDRFRKKREQPLPSAANDSDASDPDSEYRLDLELPSYYDGPEAAYARRVLIDALWEALDELPANQRDVFVAHELDGKSFKALSQETGIGINTLLARKRYAVLHLRERLQGYYGALDQ
jgi:RNA polymerase sigma factor (sigma-70 family)